VEAHPAACPKEVQIMLGKLSMIGAVVAVLRDGRQCPRGGLVMGY